MEGVIGFLKKFVSVLLHLLYDFGRSVIELLKKSVPVLLHLLHRFGRGVIGFLFVPLLHLLHDLCRLLTKILNRRVHVGLALVLPLALTLLFLCYCLGGGGRAAGKMMKAPGRGGRCMARASFENNPRAYFRNLRAGKDVVS